MYDLVIPLGTGSIWQDNETKDNEIRYCIRSFVKYFSQLGKVFIVGGHPDFFKWHYPRLVHVPCNNPFTANKDANIIYRVLKACNSGVSFDFIWSSDDQVILQPVNVDDFRPKYLGDLSRVNINPKNNWKRRLKNTYELLQREGKTTYHYESHYPMIYNKETFVEIMNKYPSDNKHGYTINTLYFNNILDEHHRIGDIKLTLEKPVMTIGELNELTKNKKFIGYNNKGLRDSALKSFLQQKFPDKCEFEI
jgi:hypothetical protein